MDNQDAFMRSIEGAAAGLAGRRAQINTAWESLRQSLQAIHPEMDLDDEGHVVSSVPAGSWHCERCGYSNNLSAQTCWGCNTPRERAEAWRIESVHIERRSEVDDPRYDGVPEVTDLPPVVGQTGFDVLGGDLPEGEATDYIPPAGAEPASAPQAPTETPAEEGPPAEPPAEKPLNVPPPEQRGVRSDGRKNTVVHWSQRKQIADWEREAHRVYEFVRSVPNATIQEVISGLGVTNNTASNSKYGDILRQLVKRGVFDNVEPRRPEGVTTGRRSVCYAVSKPWVDRDGMDWEHSPANPDVQGEPADPPQ